MLYAKYDYFLHHHLITTRASCFSENSRLYNMKWFATSLKWIAFSEFLAFHCIQYAPLCFSHLMEQIQKLLDLFLLAIGHKALNWANIKISIICFIRLSLNKRIQSWKIYTFFLGKMQIEYDSRETVLASQCII